MNTTVKTSPKHGIRVTFLILMMLFSGMGFAQTAIEVPGTVSAGNTALEAAASESMLTWFMGTKQSPSENVAKESNSKKQMMTNGSAPNRLLIKTFLKKASQYASNIA